METEDERIRRSQHENSVDRAFLYFSLLALLVFGGIAVMVVLWTGYPPLTGYSVRLAEYPAVIRDVSPPRQGVSQAYLDGRFASMKAAQGMYERSGVLEDSANSYYGVDSVPGPGCIDSDKGHFYVSGTAYAENSSMEDECDGTDWLVEQYCDGDSGKIIRYKCPNGCFQGACVLGNST